VPLLGDGQGGFAVGGGLPTGSAAPTSVALIDLDGDGVLDVVSGDASDPKVVVRRNGCALSPVDIEVTGVEVTQGIQDLANSVPQVAGRRTFVRVYVRSAGVVDAVSARLARITSNGSVIDRPLWPANPGGRISVKPDPDRSRLGDAFLFELPPSWTAGTLSMRVEVNSEHLPVETSYTNNVATRAVTFHATDPVKMELIKVQFTWAAGSGTDCGRVHVPTDVQLDVVESALRRQLPTADIVITRPDPWDSGLTMDCAVNISPGVEVGQFLRAFEAAYAAAPTDRIRIGIVDRNPIGGKASAIPGWFAIAEADPDVVVHEVGHDLGQRHVESPQPPPCNASTQPEGVNTGYPYPGGRIGGPAATPGQYTGLDAGDGSAGLFSPRRVVPSETGDIMTYCNNRWPSDYTWTRMRNYVQTTFQPGDPTGDFLSVTGIVDPSRRTISGLLAVRRPQLGRVQTPLPGGFRLRLLDGGGSLLSETAFAPRLDDNGAPTRLDETLAFLPGTRRVVVLEPTGRPIGSLRVSAHAPVVSAVTLTTGNTIPASGPVTISWTASDADGDPLVADVLWSRDAGTTFEPLASGITQPSYTLEAGRLSGTHGQPKGVVRVMVRDPVNSALADRASLTTRGAAPRVRIATPFAGASFTRGQHLALEAFASDVEDGPLDRSVTWRSDRDGALGTGGHITARLSAGDHLITAQVVDTDVRTSSASTIVHVFDVLPAGGPPVADAGPDQRVHAGVSVTLTGLGSTDPDSDPLTYYWRVTEAPPTLPSVALTGSPASPSFVARVAGTYRFELTISDQRHGASSDTVTVTVTNRASAATIRLWMLAIFLVILAAVILLVILILVSLAQD